MTDMYPSKPKAPFDFTLDLDKMVKFKTATAGVVPSLLWRLSRDWFIMIDQSATGSTDTPISCC